MKILKIFLFENVFFVLNFRQFFRKKKSIEMVFN